MISLYKPSIYDALSRLVSADYSEGSAQASANARAGGFIGGGGIIGGEIASGGHSESYHYDRNGNMDLHGRDNLMELIGVEGNRITSVGTKAISYDAKGRQVSSAYGKAVATQYNILDLPQKHTLSNADTEIDYKYSADGRKLQEKVTQSSSQTSRDYIGEFIYENGTLKKILFDGGYVDMIGDSPVYMFFIKDHLGSVRAVVSETCTVQQTNDYYPFGDLFSAAGTAGSNGNRYRFTGKELGDETGLYDFSARFLHTRFGRFTTIDPLAEKYPDISPYSYCKGNPVNFVDPDGKREWPVNPNYKGFNRRSEDNFRNPRPNHNGVDINFGSGSNDLGAPVFATHDGIVTRKRLYTDDFDSGGTRLQITSIGGDVSTFYMHLDTIGSFEEGDYIEEGTFIGTIGGSGRGEINTHTPHLHYELKIGGQYVNPSIDKDNFIDPQLFLTPVHLGELEPAIISEENNTNLIKSFDVILSVMNNVQL